MWRKVATDNVCGTGVVGSNLEATVSKPEGMMIDESYEELGNTLQIPPVFQDQKDELVSFLDQEPLMY